MRHHRQGLKLSRTSSHRNAMFRNMVTSLLKYDRIRTTDVKAKEVRRWADHLITLAKRGDLHARRQALAIVMEKNVVHKLFEEAGQRFAAMSGGYTRVIKLGRRPGDAAPMSLVELVAEPSKKPAQKTRPETEKAATAPVAATAPAPVDADTPAADEALEAAPQAETEAASDATPEEAAAPAESAPDDEAEKSE